MGRGDEEEEEKEKNPFYSSSLYRTWEKEEETEKFRQVTIVVAAADVVWCH